MSKQDQSFIDRCYKDKEGKVTIAQPPNLPIIVWFIALVLHKLFSGTFGDVMGIVSFGAIFTWAWLELFKGSNYLRRVLGLVIIILSVASRVKL